MADIKYMKAVEWDKLPAAFKKANTQRLAAHAGMWLQRKYDGCFGMAYVTQLRDLCYMVSRTGEDYSISCGHILDQLCELAVGCDADPFLVIGEVWSDALDFPTISGCFRRKSGGQQVGLDFIINDLLPTEWQTSKPYSERFEEVQQLILEGPPQYNLGFAETYRVGEWDGDPLEWAIKWKAEGGYDGAILRDPTKGYTFGLVKQGEIVKVKPVLSLDLPIVDIKTAPGEKTGRPVWSLEVEYRGVRTWVGSGVPHGEPFPGSKGWLYSIANPVIVQIDCMGLTEDGKLREPRFIAIRNDKDTPDV